MKHAYLIMTHNNFYNLKILLKLLDDERNDIYLHIDKSIADWHSNEWDNVMKDARLYFVDRVNVHWSTYTHIDALMNLLKSSTQTYHDYYHVLSGADLPIKNQDGIDAFFSTYKGKEFVGFAKIFTPESVYQKNYFVKYFRHSNQTIALWAKRGRKYLIKLQKLLRYNALKTYDKEVKKGADWFSITHDASKYLLETEPKFKKYFSNAFCPSEFFAQTLLYNSYFKEKIFNLEDENIGSQRYIDWQRGSPHTFRKEDFTLLKESDLIFARKFIENEDKEIIDLIFQYLQVTKKEDVNEI